MPLPAAASPPAAPLVTRPASAPVTSAMTLPASRLSSSRWTNTVAALFMTSITSGRSLLPPYIVVEPEAVMMGRTPMSR